MSKKTKTTLQPKIGAYPSGAAYIMIDPKHAAALLACASKDPSRPHIGGLFTQTVNNKTWLCATDGRAAVRVQCGVIDEVECNLHHARANDIKLAIAAAKLGDGIARIGLKSDETPPNLNAVFPSNQKGSEQASFDMALVSQISKTMADLGADGAYFKALGKRDPAILSNSNAAPYRIEALIMPYKVDKD